MDSNNEITMQVKSYADSTKNMDLRLEVKVEQAVHNYATISEKDVTINNLRKELDRYKVSDPKLIAEIKIIFPQLSNISLGKAERFAGTDSATLDFVMLYQSSAAVDTAKLRRWMQQRLDSRNVIFLQEKSR